MRSKNNKYGIQGCIKKLKPFLEIEVLLANARYYTLGNLITLYG